MKNKRMVLAALIVAVCGLSVGGCASWGRASKSFMSDVSGGLNRTVTVYDYNGGEIKSWTGKFDVSESENEIFFDTQDGKRVIVHGGIIVNEEN